jgi:aminoglycoside phosphotransferase (APT) family kinase protein
VLPGHRSVSAATARDMGREYRVSVLYGVFPSRRERMSAMTRRSSAPSSSWNEIADRRARAIPPEFGGRTEVNRLSRVVIDTLADLHRVDPAAVGLETLGKPEGFMQRQVSGATERWERAKTREVPLATEVSRWLKDNLPLSPPPVLLHNDWRLDNMMVSPADGAPWRCSTGTCAPGRPARDLGAPHLVDRGEQESTLWMPIPSQMRVMTRQRPSPASPISPAPVDKIGY